MRVWADLLGGPACGPRCREGADLLHDIVVTPHWGQREDVWVDRARRYVDQAREETALLLGRRPRARAEPVNLIEARSCRNY